MYPPSMNKTEKTKLPQMDEIITGIDFFIKNVVS